MLLIDFDPYIIPGTMGGGGGGSSLPADSAGYLQNDGAGNLVWDAAATPQAAGSDTQLQFNDGGTLIGGAANLLYAKTTGVVTVGATTSAAAALVIQGAGRAADGRSLVINNVGAGAAVALDIAAHAGGTAGYGISMSAIIPYSTTVVGENYCFTSINHVNIANSGGLSLTIGAGDQASNKDHILLRRIGAGAHTGNAITILRDNSTAGNGSAAGVDADVLGTISFKGYNDNATPAIKEFARITTSIVDASDGTEDGLIDFQVMDNGALQSMMTIVPGGVQFPNNPTAPSAILANAVQMWSADYAAGDARLYIMGEAQTGKVVLGNAAVLLDDPDVAHGMTTIATTDTFAVIDANNGSYGGLRITGLSDYGDNPGLTLRAFGPDSSAPMQIICGKSNGTGVAALTSTRFMLDVKNLNTIVGGYCETGPYVATDAALYFKETADVYGTNYMGPFPYATFTSLLYVTADVGGLNVVGGSNGTDSGLILYGHLGVSNPTDTVPAVLIKGSKYASGANPGAMNPAETILQINNYTTILSTMYGDGTLALIRAQFDPINMADDSVQGETFNGVAGENLVWGDVVYLKSDGKFWKADYNATTTTPAVAFCTATIAADATGRLLKRGWVRDDSAYNFTFGAQTGTIYLGTTGAITQTAPTGSGDQVQALGWALEADIFYFEPQLVMVEV